MKQGNGCGAVVLFIAIIMVIIFLFSDGSSNDNYKNSAGFESDRNSWIFDNWDSLDKTPNY